MKTKFDVIGMSCSACVGHVQKAISRIEGVISANVNLLTNSMEVEYDEKQVNIDTIISAVREAGYDAKEAESKKKLNNEVRSLDETKEMKKRLVISFVFLVPLLYISMGHMIGLKIPSIFHGEKNALIYAVAQLILTIPIVFVNMKYYISGFKAMKNKAPNMDSLIAIGSAAALAYGIYAIIRIGISLSILDYSAVTIFKENLYFESAGTILTLITLGKFLETKSKKKTLEAINKLTRLTPKTAKVVLDGEEREIFVEDIKYGDILIVRPGESIPVDGEVLKGESYVDQSAITGESIAVRKEVGSKVISATINTNGVLEYKAEKVGEDTTISQIIKLVEGASSSKAPIGKLADKVSSVFVPIVIIIAIIATVIWLICGYSFEFSLSIGISVLVISCPCALGLATPVSIMVGTGKGASQGVLIKSAEGLELLHKAHTIVLDKTGTITEGKPKVIEVLTNNTSEEELIQILASLESKSEHPIANAILERAKERNILLKETTEFTAISGKGVNGTIDGKTYFAGNVALMKDNNIDTKQYDDRYIEFSNQGKTVIYISNREELIGLVTISDSIKKDSKKAIEELKKLGLEVIMLTGDNKKVAEHIGEELGITKVISEVLPQDKDKEIQKLQKQGKRIAMVGDGINDSPALVRADVGIAIGAGTDIAIESADIVLVKNSLVDVVYGIRLSKATINNIKSNLFWAFFYNCIGTPLACGMLYPFLGITLNPGVAAAAMSLSSVCVVLNSLRLKLFK